MLIADYLKDLAVTERLKIFFILFIGLKKGTLPTNAVKHNNSIIILYTLFLYSNAPLIVKQLQELFAFHPILFSSHVVYTHCELPDFHESHHAIPGYTLHHER